MVDWLRLVIIIGGYILLRPILLRLGTKFQEKSLEKENKRRTDEGLKEEKERDKKAKQGLEWGATARIRQRKIEERGVIDGEESDSDELEEFLEK
jgi:Protein trafficking PGA2